MGSVLAALTTIIVTALAAALAAPYVLDWNQYKSFFEAQTAKFIGRAVRIDGEVGLTILPVPEVHLKGLRVADEAGSFQRPFAEVENFTMVLSLSPLLSGTIEAKTIELDQPIIRFVGGADGQGNWPELGPEGAAAILPARDVILQNVAIRDGAVEFRGKPDAPATRIDRISGSFSADSLSGPFRFTGMGALGRDQRELKLSAGRMQRDGSFRFKASLGSAADASLYQLDGDLKTAGGVAQYTGPVQARLALGMALRGKGDRQVQPPRPKAIELRAASTITLQDARLQDIALTVTEDDRPQNFTGSAYASWGETPRLDLSIQSALLDIDQMTGPSGSKTNPLAAIATLPQIFQGWAFEPRQGSIKAKIQQANLGGDLIEGITFSAAHNRGAWEVETFEARLPGDAPLSIKGVLQPGERIAFNGDFNLSGRHLSRLLRWAAPNLGAVDTGDAQNFSLASGLTLAGQRIDLNKGQGALGESSFAGDLSYDYGEASKLLLMVQSERLDLRSVFGGYPFSPEGFGGADGQEALAPAPADGKTNLPDALRTLLNARNSQVSLRIAQLQLPEFEARDVRSVFRYQNGTLDIRELNLATSDGLSVRADGLLTGFDTSPNGSVNLAVNAPSAPALANLAKLLGLESFGAAARRRMDALAPLKLSGNLSGNRKDKLLNLTLAGSAAGSELTLNGRLDGELNALKQARIDLNGTIGNADGRRLIAQLAPEMPMGAEAAARSGAGVLKVSALGALKDGLVSKLELRTPDAEGRFEGQIAPLDEPWGLNGELWLRAGQASTALSMLRLSPGGTPVAGPLDLRAGLSKDKTKFQATNVSMQIGGETITGTASVETAGMRPAANLDVRASSVMLPKLAAYLVDWDRKDVNAAAADALGGAPYWPNQSFAFGSFEALDGTLKIRAPQLTLADGIVLANAQFDAALKDARLSVDALKGQLYGGNFNASGTLSASEGKAVLKARLKLEKAELARLTLAGDGKPLAKGLGELRLSLAGEGLSPRGLLTVLSGKGRLRLNKGNLFGLSPAVLAQAADTYLSEEIPQRGRLTQRIAKDLRQGTVPYRGFIAPVVVNDGVLQIRKGAFKSADYKAVPTLLVDLSTLRLDSEWALFARGKAKAAETLPPVRMVFAGPVASFAGLQPQLHTEEYERYLSMRRMDRDMEKLEKLGRQPGQLQPSAGNPPPLQPGSRPGLPNPPLSAGVTPLNTAPQQAPPVAGWSTGTEAAKPQSGLATGADAAPPAASQQAPGGFEDEIRRILEQQQQKEQPATTLPPKPPASSGYTNPTAPSGLSYRNEPTSLTSPGAEPAAQAETANAASVLPGAAIPVPQRKSEARQPRRPGSPPQHIGSDSLWDLLR